MKIFFNSISTHIASFQQKMLDVLSPQQKKVLLVASIAFAFLAICYAVRRYFDIKPSKENDGKLHSKDEKSLIDSKEGYYQLCKNEFNKYLEDDIYNQWDAEAHPVGNLLEKIRKLIKDSYQSAYDSSSPPVDLSSSDQMVLFRLLEKRCEEYGPNDQLKIKLCAIRDCLKECKEFIEPSKENDGKLHSKDEKSSIDSREGCYESFKKDFNKYLDKVYDPFSLSAPFPKDLLERIRELIKDSYRSAYDSSSPPDNLSSYDQMVLFGLLEKRCKECPNDQLKIKLCAMRDCLKERKDFMEPEL